jgi:hypothetical protein
LSNYWGQFIGPETLKNYLLDKNLISEAKDSTYAILSDSRAISEAVDKLCSTHKPTIKDHFNKLLRPDKF